MNGMTIEQLLSKFSETTADQWQKRNGAWVHEDAYVSPTAWIKSPAIIRRGEILGGDIVGGIIYGGEIYGGVIHGGIIYGGEIHGGKVYSGEIHGGKWLSAPLFISGSRHPVTHCKPGHIKIGCHLHSIEVWRKTYKRVGIIEGYTDEQIEEYILYVNLVAARDKALFGE